MKTHIRELTLSAAWDRGLNYATRTQFIYLYFFIDSSHRKALLWWLHMVCQLQILHPYNFKANKREKQTDLFLDIPAQSHWLWLTHMLISEPLVDLGNVSALTCHIVAPRVWRVINSTGEAQKLRQGEGIYSQKEVWLRFLENKWWINARDKNK